MLDLVRYRQGSGAKYGRSLSSASLTRVSGGSIRKSSSRYEGLANALLSHFATHALSPGSFETTVGKGLSGFYEAEKAPCWVHE